MSTMNQEAHYRRMTQDSIPHPDDYIDACNKYL